jgi:hypothetical protein
VGIQVTSGLGLIVQGSVVRGFAGSGINFAPASAARLFVADTTLTNNGGSGIAVAGAGSVALARQRHWQRHGHLRLRRQC